MLPRQCLQDRLVDIPGRHGNLHTLPGKQPGTACTDARAATYDKRYLVHSGTTLLLCGFDGITEFVLAEEDLLTDK